MKIFPFPGDGALVRPHPRKMGRGTTTPRQFEADYVGRPMLEVWGRKHINVI